MVQISRNNLSIGFWWLLFLKVFFGLSICLLIMVCFSSNTVEAHKPSFPDGLNKSPYLAFQLDDIDISQAIYQILEKNEQVWLSFDPQKSNSDTANIQLGIPVLEETQSFRPVVAVVSQNLNKIDLPFDIPEGFGAILYEPNDMPIREFHEPFTDTNSWILIEDEFEVIENGIHYVVIFSTTNQSGKFWFATGTKEVFGLSDISNLNKNIYKVKNFHKPSISVDAGISLQEKKIADKTLFNKIGDFRTIIIYFVSAIILISLIYILFKKKILKNTE